MSLTLLLQLTFRLAQAKLSPQLQLMKKRLTQMGNSVEASASARAKQQHCHVLEKVLLLLLQWMNRRVSQSQDHAADST